MPFNARGTMLGAALVLAASVPGLAQQAAPAAAQQTGRCGGLFCDMYYSSRAAQPPGTPEPAPGQPGSIFLPCHDFVCGMFGGRTPDQPVAIAEPAPPPAEPAAKPKTKRARHAAERTARNDTKPKAGEPAAQ